MEFTQSDIDQLKNLEESLWRSETRFDPNYIENVLATDFFEFGRSGRLYSRAEIIAVSPQEINAQLPLQNFQVHPLDENNALVTYLSEVKYEHLERANRCSIWSKTRDGWKLRFHQGTPLG
ncbi:MAG: DUF4440 domain-containing protein [Bdellovibrionales bacterium]